MKKFLVFFILSLIIFTGCYGPDGEDGDAYMALNDETYYGISYLDFEMLPSVIYYGTYYSVDPGTYDVYWCTVFDDYYYIYYYWSASITIDIEEGEEGGIFFQEGADGEDSYFDFDIYDDASYNWSVWYDAQALNKIDKTKSPTITNSKDQVLDLSGYEAIVVKEYTQVSGKYKMTVKIMRYSKP
jgi:hypothetical protein